MNTMNTLKTPTGEPIIIQRGDKILITGALGSGKTSLLKEIAATFPKDQFDSLFQTLDDNFIPGTVAENLAFTLENNAIPFREMKLSVLACAKDYHLTDELETDISELSTYKKQVLAMAQILIHPTDILVLDEPLFLPEEFDGTLIVAGNFEHDLFDCVIDLSVEIPTQVTPELTLKRQINPNKAILSVTELVDQMSFAVYEGEKVAITAPAELPIADMLAGFRSTSGEIDFYYEDVTYQSLDKRGRKIGYIMANPDDMIFVKRVSDAEIPDELLALCQLTPLKNAQLSDLSHRQKRLFTTACILKQATPIVIIDQPEFEGFLEILSYLDRQGVTLILITNQDIFLPFMDRQEVF
ncbi:MAG: ATP-binding cassette domain-containing protein [Lactococcus chungangensis]|uniref:Energy-coupling factor transporter ATP-binding protein EcfA2 n=2 Tax=Pseudolactococcus chungangensis CAU 28 = DSM 22330 TaxID=1122154 RepID=A0A1K2H963_9LACT|nr:ATP-binding cassette domain-containing protein [Lactococcus chungangensis]MDD3015865.1 ATP-binding cassette domain-containing protein [Lactococcus chungangensis]NCB82293.1 ATP-binding cassette domain-containing protein [Bacilli bacterium]SFZ73133.1 Energy-coupling factor transporter ATP-binding protein EcfA2 [Lactococcus chungangensis CAU 28 = DSM 22330]